MQPNQFQLDNNNYQNNTAVAIRTSAWTLWRCKQYIFQDFCIGGVMDKLRFQVGMSGADQRIGICGTYIGICGLVNKAISA